MFVKQLVNNELLLTTFNLTDLLIKLVEALVIKEPGNNPDSTKIWNPLQIPITALPFLDSDLIALIILATLQNNTCGLLLAVLFIILLEYNYEGLSKAKQEKKNETGIKHRFSKHTKEGLDDITKKMSKSGHKPSIPIEPGDTFEGLQLDDRMDDENSMKGMQKIIEGYIKSEPEPEPEAEDENDD